MSSQLETKSETQTPSTSCPQLTVDEITNSGNAITEDTNMGSFPGNAQSIASTHGSRTSLRCRLSGIPSNQNLNYYEDNKLNNEPGRMPISSKSLLTKTYSFKRIISFRSDTFRKGNNRYMAGDDSLNSNQGRSPPSPYYWKDHHRNNCYNPSSAPAYKPLTFSFLGQIYAKKSIKGERSMSRRM